MRRIFIIFTAKVQHHCYLLLISHH